MKNLVGTKIYSFNQKSVYLKHVAFLPIIFFKRKSFLKIVYACDRHVPSKFCLPDTNYAVNFFLNLSRKA